MAITVGQIPQALLTVEEIGRNLNTLRMLLNQAKQFSDNGWQVDLGGGLVITVTPEQRTALVAQYDTLKAQLVSTFQTLP